MRHYPIEGTGCVPFTADKFGMRRVRGDIAQERQVLFVEVVRSLTGTDFVEAMNTFAEKEDSIYYFSDRMEWKFLVMGWEIETRANLSVSTYGY